MILAYKELEIELSLEGIIQVETFRLTQTLNDHVFLTMKMLVSDEMAEQFVNMASVVPVVVREKETSGGQTVFQGKIETVYTRVEQGLSFLYLEAYSYTKDWDRKEKSRSFLDGSMTYMAVAGKVLKDYGTFDIKSEAGCDGVIPELLLQYEESDWVFLRRLASHFNTYLMVDAKSDCGKVYFGIPDIQIGTELHKEDYVLSKNMAHYTKVLRPDGVLSQEASQWCIRTRKFLQVGETVAFNKVSAIVIGMELYTLKGELVYEYTLSRREGLKREKEKNPRIYGMSIPATVKERSGNRVRVHFDIDPVYEPAAQLKYFTYAIESSSFYCMPVEGSRVHIYFPEHDEQSAVAVHAIGSGSGDSAGGGGSKNPDNKQFSDPSGSAMDMTKDYLSYAPDSSGSILLSLNKAGFMSLTGKDINIRTQKGMMAGGEIPVKNLMISGENKVVLQVGDSGDDIITLEDKTDVKSTLISHKADSHPQAVPSAAEITAELTKTDAADRDAQNAALTNTLIENKQKSKQKFLNGVLSIATVVGLTALTICTGGATAPLLVAAGVKAAFAVADVAEGLDGYSKVNSLDASRPSNFIRDTIFGGNEDAYNFASTITDIVFDVVSGKALTKAAKFGKFTKFMCPKSQVANVVSQMGGSLIFGGIKEYQISGRVDVKNMAFNAALGLFKGGTGNAIMGKAQNFAKTKVGKKIIGAGVQTVYGTAVDVTVDAALPGRKVDVLGSLKENFISSGLGQLFGEPVDAVSGAFLITASDYIIPDIQESIRLERRYNSTVKREGIMGVGWAFAYEGKLYQDGSKRHVILDSGHHLIFQWDGEKAINVTNGCGWFELVKDHEEWLVRDMKKHKTYRYASNGLLMSITDKNGQAMSFTYHGENLEKITTALNYEINVTMREGRLIQLTDTLGRTMQYRYEDGRLSDVVHMDQGITHYEYDANGYLTKAVDQAKVAYLENRYDANGRMVHQTLANGDVYQAEYMDEERKVHVFSSIGNKNVTYEYGKEMQILSVYYEDGTSESYKYSEAGYRICKKNRLGHETCWSYDSHGLITEEKQKNWLTTIYQYSEAGDLVEKKDNAGRRFIYEYDDNHNLIKEKEKASSPDEWFSTIFLYDRKGRLLEETDPLGKTTRYHYNEYEGKPSVITYPDGEEVHFEYDAMGRLMAEEDVCSRLEYGYNARNHTTMVRDGEGNESRYLYDGMGRLLAMYPPKAWKQQEGEYTYQYDFLDRRIDTIRPDGSHERQILDGEGNILKRIHPNSYAKDMENGEGIVYDYDSDGNQIRIHHPDGGCERIFYDANGNRIKHVMPESYNAIKDDGEGWQYTYDDGGHLERVIGPDGSQQAEYTYDLLGNPTRKTDALGRTTWYTYDLKGQLCEVYRPFKEKDQEILYQRAAYTYDANGNKISEQRFGGYWSLDGQIREEGGNGLHLKFSYDKRDRLIRVEDGLGAVIQYRYDVQGKRIYEEKTISDEISQVIHYNYDKAGRLIEKKEELDSGLPAMKGEAKAAITRYYYDENGNRTRIQTPEGYEIFREYDSCDRLSLERTLDKQNGVDRTVQVSYDYAGNITKIVKQGKGSEVWKLDYQYDLKNRITHVKDCLGPVFRYEYDLNDRLEKENLVKGEQEAEKENSFQYSYDLYGNIILKTNGAGTILEQNQYHTDGHIYQKRTADGNELTYQYGIHGLETEVYTSRSRKEGKAAQSYHYDSNGRMNGIVDGNQNYTDMDTDSWGRIRSVQNADGGSESYTYNSMGLVTSTTDANGGVITYRYNSQGKVCEIIDQDGNSETFRYDREGRMILHVDRNGNRVKTVYNIDGNPVMERACDCNGGNEVIRSWEYDEIGNKKKAVAGGFCYTYEYRPDGKLMKKSSSGRLLVSCTYYKDGNLETLTDVSGHTVLYGYDRLGQLESICDKTGNEIVRYCHTPGGKLKEIYHGNGMHTVYEYDTDNNIVRLTLKKEDESLISDFCYEYDLNGNRTLKSGKCILPGEENLREQRVCYQYDSMNRLLEERYNDEPIRYIYDRCGNRLEKVDITGKEVYNYNRKNQLINRQNDAEKTAWQYDQQGNILEEISSEGKTEYNYNAFNQQTAVLTKDGQVQENHYDAEYLRAGVVENGRVSRFLFYNGELLTESDQDDTVTYRYLLGYGVAAGCQNGNKGYRSYHLDEQNSTAYIIDSGQRIENSYQYDAPGGIRSNNEKIHNRILYTGQQYDQITGQYYLRARYYNPLVGRFTQEDVYRGDGLNLYAYCHNNPMIYCDPSGFAYSLNEVLSALKTDSNGNKYVLNHDHDTAIKYGYTSPDDFSGTLQSHHGLQQKWASSNLSAYGYNPDLAPTITLETNANGVKNLPHTLITNQQNSYNRENGSTSGTLQERLVLGAQQQIKAGVSRDVVIQDLENNYKMIDKLNRNNADKIASGNLESLTYSRKEIESSIDGHNDKPKSEKCP